MRTLTLLPAGTYDAVVHRVHDGDTIHVLIPVAVKVRLEGIQAAELSTDKGKAVAAWLRRRVEGQTVELRLGGEYKYGGERMGSVFVGGESVAAAMVAAGLAVAWDGTGPRPAGGVKHDGDEAQAAHPDVRGPGHLRPV